MLIDPSGGDSKGEQLNAVLPKSPSCLGPPVSPSDQPAGGGACIGETHHAQGGHAYPLTSVGSQNLQTIDLSTTRPMYGPQGSVNSRWPHQRNNTSSSTVLNHRESHSGSWDNYLSSSYLDSSSGARQRTQSPGYDFRETTARRRSYQETQAGAGHPSQHPAGHNSGSHYNSNDHERKSESPSRKRRRMSHGGVELATSPSPPLVRPWQTPPNHQVTLQQHHRSLSMAASVTTNTPNQRYHSQSSGDWCNNSGRRSNGRRSPPSVRRQSQRQRERQMRTNQTPPNGIHNSSSNVASGHDRRAFHPPTNTGVHHPRGPSNNQTGAHHPTHPPGLPGSTHPQSVPMQPHIIIDLSNDVRTAAVHVPSSVPLSIPVSVPSYAVPICTAHSIPAACGIHHGPYPTLSVNSATGGAMGHSSPFPICGMGHIPMCSVHIPSCGTAHHLPISHASAPPMLPQDALVSHLHHSHHHVPHHQVQYISAPPPPHQTRSSEMELLGERQAAAAAAAAAAFHVPSATHHNPSLTPSPPLHILQEPILRAAPSDLHHMHSQRLSLSQALGRQRRGGHPRAWRNQVSPSAPLQPTYPSWFLRYLFPNPPVSTGYQVELENEDAEVENYEALLNLAERLGEAKPRGLSKAYIDQLPSYRYNPDTHQSINDQTCCVVCMCDFEQRQLLRVLPCSHEFHARCVDKWLKTNRTCPICRSDASEMKAQSD